MNKDFLLITGIARSGTTLLEAALVEMMNRELMGYMHETGSMLHAMMIDGVAKHIQHWSLAKIMSAKICGHEKELRPFYVLKQPYPNPVINSLLSYHSLYSVHVIRHPLDVFLSQYKRDVERDNDWPDFFQFNLHQHKLELYKQSLSVALNLKHDNNLVKYERLLNIADKDVGDLHMLKRSIDKNMPGLMKDMTLGEVNSMFRHLIQHQVARNGLPDEQYGQQDHENRRGSNLKFFTDMILHDKDLMKMLEVVDYKIEEVK